MVGEGEFESRRTISLEVRMPMKLMGMVRGRGWDRKEGEEEENEEEGGRRQGGREIRWLGLASGGVNLTWVWRVWSGLSLTKLMFSLVCMIILSDSFILTLPQIPISKQRLEHSCPTSGLLVNILSMPISYPFSLVLTSATIPTALTSYLENGHPSLISLSVAATASPDLAD
jgi:ATP-dependent RNA helicase MRH4